MSVNHHLLAKATTDSILSKFKSGEWKSANEAGIDFYRVGCDSAFPSPDASFYDATKKILVTFEFKPPTETKRGVLTGLGQSIAYLRNSNLSYLIVPQTLEDFRLGEYMSDLFSSQINGKLPIGLILYENNIPINVSLAHNVSVLSETQSFSTIPSGRFWAKHLDMPIPLFHLILHCYYLKKVEHLEEDAFAYCWREYIVPSKVFETLEPCVIFDCEGNPIKTLSGKKNISFFEKRIAKINLIDNLEEKECAINKLINDADTRYIGDNYYNSIRKNFVTFLKHIGVIDSIGSLTEDGFKLYHLGLVNGPNSKIFIDYFTQRILMTGHHLDLIFDLDIICNKHKGHKNMQQIRQLMEAEYEAKGMIKRNPNRMSGEESRVEFLKYEFILWGALNLLIKTEGIPEISFNWKKITEVCSLPEL